VKRALLGALLGGMSGGCSLGLHQTAKTLEAGEVRVGGGLMVLRNRPADVLEDTPEARQQGQERIASAPELGVRVGVGRRTDLGIGMYLGPGLRVDAKHNLIENTRPYAVAPRVGLGYTNYDGSKLYSWLAGLIGSYRLLRGFSVYLGGTFANHHVYRPASDNSPTLGPNERLAERTGWGDGLFQGALGLNIQTGKTTMFLEYGRWIPLQNDPGDLSRFVPTHLLSFTIHSCTKGCGEAPR
jgi:hypothetical protein